MTLLAERVASPARPRVRLSGYAAGLAAIGAAGLAARLVLLGRQPISRDEAFTAVVARRSWGGMLDVVRHDSAPPLSYVLDHVATVLSSSPSLLRLPSALAGAAAIPVAAALGRRLGGDAAGLGAAAVCAALPSLVIPSRDARMYALAATLVMTFALVLWRALERPDRGRLAGLAAVTAAALLTHYLDAVAVVATLAAAALVLRERGAWPRVLAGVAAGAVPLAAWLPLAHAQADHAGQPFWASGLGPAPEGTGRISGRHRTSLFRARDPRLRRHGANGQRDHRRHPRGRHISRHRGAALLGQVGRRPVHRLDV